MSGGRRPVAPVALGTVVLLALIVGAPRPAWGQTPAVFGEIDEGVVALAYATRPGTRVCAERGTGFSPRRGLRIEIGRNGDPDSSVGCGEGIALVEVAVESGSVVGVRLLAPGERATAGARDLGRVSGPEGARLLLAIARTDGPGAEDALVAAVLADSTEVWPDLLDLARDRNLSLGTRETALFWLGQEAAAVTGALAATAADDPDREIREAAVFALSRRAEEESLPALMRLARDAVHPDTRRSALFWLARSSDPAVPGFFAELIRAGRTGPLAFRMSGPQAPRID